MQRRYILNVPTNYDNTKPYKLIIAYHELNGNDDEMYRNQYYHLLSLSNNSTIFVAPNGQQNGASCTQASGCGWPNSNNSDLALADAVVAQVEQNFCVDTNRIFATGWSYGGSMSYKTACERPLGGVTNGFVRAIAVYSGAQLSGNCTPTKPVAYYASHGTSDSVLSYDGNGGGGVKLAQNFATANGCTWMTPTKVTSGNHVCTNIMGCMTGYPVEFCSFNGDHTPDPRDGSATSWEYQNVWTFFSQF
jgi:poly(3-hydroxybutyrate) depolymerase